ncbi:ThiF family adenylyltransferase [Desulfurococcaceae archaeon MEX13E-LK6-19]|nr:ThiF family adenylyltransferase [Desulfurococcaceae archaeon MEX13E-LK6-19]
MPMGNGKYYGFELRLLKHYLNKKKELQGINEKRIAIIGCGSIGSIIAEILARFNPRELILIDYDIVDIENVGYQPYGPRYIGVPKSKALAEKLLLTYPFLDTKITVITEPIPSSDLVISENELTGLLNKFDDIIKRSDVLIAAVDKVSPRRILTIWSIAFGKPLVSLGADRDDGWVGGYCGKGTPSKPLCPDFLQANIGGQGYAINPVVTYTVSAEAAWLALNYAIGTIKENVLLSIYAIHDTINIKKIRPRECNSKYVNELTRIRFSNLHELNRWIIKNELW